ncbi:MAG: MarR family transcriptional regulator [Marinilabiliaceae bacterium]|nr:MarR family transcriptional regulator [Marinilabiliaceae bacterium]
MESPEPSYPQLKLSNQLCFPFYAASMLITRHYQPLLDTIGLTYPQYLVMMVLWEKDRLTVGQISSQLMLNTNTITPLLKRLEKSGLLVRTRSEEDERRVLVTLTDRGRSLQQEAAQIPMKLVEKVDYPIDKAMRLMQEIRDFLDALKGEEP